MESLEDKIIGTILETLIEYGVRVDIVDKNFCVHLEGYANLEELSERILKLIKK